MKRSQHWFEPSLRVPLVGESLPRGSPLVLVSGDWRWRGWRGGGRGWKGLVDENLVRGWKTVQAVHRPV